MENNKSLPLLFPIEPEKFIESVRCVVKEELQAILPSLKLSTFSTDEPLLTRKEIAEYLRISLVTLTDWVKRGLPSHSKRGRVLFLKSEVLQWLKENRPQNE